jgi:acyl carrier protein phosphodiesterase
LGYTLDQVFCDDWVTLLSLLTLVVNLLTRTNCTFTCMNFLAHAYLSFENPQILVGNMISDFVKGAKKNDFEKDIRQGISLHREIDSYTDLHPETKKAMLYFRPLYRLYSGPIIDIIFDHFLAIELDRKEGSLKSFTSTVYKTLDEHRESLPENFYHLLFYMKRDDWLYGYRFKEGIHRSLGGLARRAKYLNDIEPAYEIFNEHYEALSEHFSSFFPDVKHYAKQRFGQMVY